MRLQHALRQGPVVRAMVRAALRKPHDRPLETPTPGRSDTVRPRPEKLIRDYLLHVGGDPVAYRGEVPGHLFPQWGFPLLTEALSAAPYDLRRALNGGCRMVFHKPIPAGEPLQLRARVESVDDDGSRAILEARLWTGTASAPDALESTLRTFVPLKKREGGRKKERPRVPDDATLVDRWKVPADAGLTFAALTGDFNPIHWVPPAARAAGFRNTILHGFSTVARAIESLNQARFAGDVHRLHAIDVRFTRPLVLPARPGVFLHDEAGAFSVGTEPGGPCFLTGTYELKP